MEEIEQFKAILDMKSVFRIYMDSNALPRIWESEILTDFVQQAHDAQKEFYLAMPHIFRSKTIEKFENNYTMISQCGMDGVLIRNIETYQFLKNHNYIGNIVIDHNLYEFNSYAKAFWNTKEVESHTAALELNYRELQEVGLENSELVVYGYLPMMVSAQCVQKTTSGCKNKKGRLNFTDRYQKTFVVKNLCDYCYNLIYNTSPLVLLDQKDEIRELKPKALRLHFTIEDAEQARDIAALYESVFIEGKHIPEYEQDFTRGHFKRGIK